MASLKHTSKIIVCTSFHVDNLMLSKRNHCGNRKCNTGTFIEEIYSNSKKCVVLMKSLKVTLSQPAVKHSA